MNDDDRQTDERLERLARATAAIGPSPNFSARVMQALEGERQVVWFDDVRRAARRGLPALALAAAISLVWAVESESAFDEAVATFPYDTVELEW